MVYLGFLSKANIARRCTPFSSLSASSPCSQQYTPRPKVSHPMCPPALLAVPSKITWAASSWVFPPTTGTFTASTPAPSADTPMSVAFNHSVIHVLDGLINSLLDRPLAHLRRTTTMVSVPLRLLPCPAVPVVAAQSLGLHPLQWQLPLHAHLPLRISRSGQA